MSANSVQYEQLGLLGATCKHLTRMWSDSAGPIKSLFGSVWWCKPPHSSRAFLLYSHTACQAPCLREPRSTCPRANAVCLHHTTTFVKHSCYRVVAQSPYLPSMPASIAQPHPCGRSWDMACSVVLRTYPIYSVMLRYHLPRCHHLRAVGCWASAMQVRAAATLQMCDDTTRWWLLLSAFYKHAKW